MMFKKKDPSQNSSERKDNKKRKKIKKKSIAILCAIAVAIAATGFGIWYFAIREPENQTGTALDQIGPGDLMTLPQAEFAKDEQIEVKDYTVYGTSLVFYDRTFEPMKTDGFFGRNCSLRNIATDETVTATFSGGADSGIDLQLLDEGVYEVYLADGYKPKRAYMPSYFLSDPFYTMSDHGKANEIRIIANPTFLRKYNVVYDQAYLYLTVTKVDEMLPTVYDVAINPSGTSGVNEYGITPAPLEDGFNESQQSWQLALLVKMRLEQAGLRVMLTRDEDTYTTTLGGDSSMAKAYEANAKVFLTLAMNSNPNYGQPYIVSSPFTNAKLGDLISSTCQNLGAPLQVVSHTSELKQGNIYDDYVKDQAYQYTRFSMTDEIREAGGKVTSAGMMSHWQGNAAFSDQYGMNSVVFYYASTANIESHAYYAEHVDAIADGIAQGILDYASIHNSIKLD